MEQQLLQYRIVMSSVGGRMILSPAGPSRTTQFFIWRRQCHAESLSVQNNTSQDIRLFLHGDDKTTVMSTVGWHAK